jgi:Xaa-Pro aminopeptidase
MDHFLARREHLTRWLIEQDLDAVLVSNPVNVSYLTNFSGEASYLIVSRDRALLVSDGRFVVQLQEECPELAVHIRPPAQRITPAVAGVLQQLGLRRVGCDASHLTVAEFEQFRELTPTITWKPGVGAVEQFRVVKDAVEIAALRSAIGMAERALGDFRASLGPEDTEKILSDRMEMLLRSEGASRSSFPTIAAVGTRAALPHCPPSAAVVAGAELLLVDWGARERFYCSDLTRVFALGSVTPKFAEVYRAVLRAQQAAIALIRPGVTGQAVDAAARQVLEAAGFGAAFNHGLGHGIGMEVHEGPALRPGSDVVLRPGMVVTVEPGVYLPAWGGVRIEDDVLVTPDGHEVLTQAPRDLEQAVVEW